MLTLTTIVCEASNIVCIFSFAFTVSLPLFVFFCCFFFFVACASFAKCKERRATYRNADCYGMKGNHTPKQQQICSGRKKLTSSIHLTQNFSEHPEIVTVKWWKSKKKIQAQCEKKETKTRPKQATHNSIRTNSDDKYCLADLRCSCASVSVCLCAFRCAGWISLKFWWLWH